MKEKRQSNNKQNRRQELELPKYEILAMIGIICNVVGILVCLISFRMLIFTIVEVIGLYFSIRAKKTDSFICTVIGLALGIVRNIDYYVFINACFNSYKWCYQLRRANVLMKYDASKKYYSFII